jgi:hypothetical protein
MIMGIYWPDVNTIFHEKLPVDSTVVRVEQAYIINIYNIWTVLSQTNPVHNTQSYL